MFLDLSGDFSVAENRHRQGKKEKQANDHKIMKYFARCSQMLVQARSILWYKLKAFSIWERDENFYLICSLWIIERLYARLRYNYTLNLTKRYSNAFLGNDNSLKKLLIVKHILLVSTFEYGEYTY